MTVGRAVFWCGGLCDDLIETADHRGGAPCLCADVGLALGWFWANFGLVLCWSRVGRALTVRRLPIDCVQTAGW